MLGCTACTAAATATAANGACWKTVAVAAAAAVVVGLHAAAGAHQSWFFVLFPPLTAPLITLNTTDTIRNRNIIWGRHTHTNSSSTIDTERGQQV